MGSQSDSGDERGNGDHEKTLDDLGLYDGIYDVAGSSSHVGTAVNEVLSNGHAHNSADHGAHPPHDNSQDELEKERLHFEKVLKTFQSYERANLARTNGKVSEFCSMKSKYQKLCPKFLGRQEKMKECIKANQVFLNEVVADVAEMFVNENPLQSGDHVSDSSNNQPTLADHDKIRTTLKQLVRDWATEGEEERNLCYKPILDQILLRLGKVRDRSAVRVLVPGAGLGRLPFEIAAAGFQCQGNEWSVFMLFMSSFMMNKTEKKDQFTIYPWVTQTSNQPKEAAQLRSVSIPDVSPRTILSSSSNLSMSAGDFTTIYKPSEGSPDQFDCIACCFFIDTAHNIVSYIEKFYNILKPGGYFINLGPLLYHYSDQPGEFSLELTYEEVLEVFQNIGFKIIHHEAHHTAPYLKNKCSMLQYTYTAPLLVAKKPSDSLVSSQNSEAH